MIELFELEPTRNCNPVDLVEQVATINDWDFERSCDDEINILVGGVWADYSISFSWMEDFEALHLSCVFDLKVPDGKSSEIATLLSMINEQLLIGHFDFWSKDGTGMFRQSLMLNGGAEPNDEQLKCLMNSALEACERYYQAFQFVIWAGHSPKEALEAVMFETHGSC